MNNKIRLRFPPSPTGAFHIGSARTALFNYLVAKKNKGEFVLRIEDTDKERSKLEYEKDIMRSIKWLGLEWDEGPKEDGKEKGKYGPYRQSQRSDIYKKYLQKLLDEDKAYRCYCTKEELDKEREEQLKRGEAPKYSGKCSNIKEKRDADFVIRFRCPKHEKIVFNDMIRGEVSFNSNDIGDFVIGKSDYSALYNFAVVIDDYKMGITHVVRGEDHISNTPRQILLQKALEINTPYYAHLPLILGSDRNKLSKRHAATSLYEYKEKGYLPEALINFLAFLGWNPGGEREIYSLKEIVENFDIKRCKKGGAIFNIEKLNSINSYYIKEKDINELTMLCIPYLISSNLINSDFKEKQFIPAYGGKQPIASFKLFESEKEISFKKLSEIISLHKERMKYLSEISDFTDYFFKEIDYDVNLLYWKEMTKEEVAESIDKSLEILSNIKEWNKENIEQQFISSCDKDKGRLLWPLRAALSGKKASAGPFDIMLIFGPEETKKRLKTAKNKLLK